VAAIDRSNLRWIARRFVPWLAALNLAWEAAHLPLYTLWREAGAAYLAFSVLHCTLGDVLIGTLALLACLVVLPARSRALAIPLLAALILGYTVFSEWLNTAILESWTYSELMPVVQFKSLRIGLSPLLQALVLPASAALLAGFLTSIKTGAAGGGHTMKANVD
jgi:hypothetical protein